MPFFRWVPYAIAACLMILGIFLVRQILDLKSQLLATRADEYQLWQSNALMKLCLVTLEAKDASYASSKIIVAWDSYQHRGVVAVQNLPSPLLGHCYQLWVLDPAAAAPINAGLIPAQTSSGPAVSLETGSERFAVGPVSMPSPGFAISLEPGGGSPAPTGPILFAVAPGP